MADSIPPASLDSSLSRLFEVGADAETAWTPSELGAIWRHQLATPLSTDLSTPELPPALRTFGDLLTAARPPLVLLELVKQFARDTAAETPPALPREITTTLYLAANCAAQVHLGQKITSATPAAFASQLARALAHPWLDSATRQLFVAARG
jgi:hypothetical protein